MGVAVQSRYTASMRLWSTEESVRAGEPSFLAIAETLAAMAVSVWIGVHFGTWMHIAIGACIAPLLLLRTEPSCRSGVAYAQRLGDRLVGAGPGKSADSTLADVWQLFSFMVRLTILILIAPLVRVFVTCVHVAASPMLSLRAIPVNWWRSILSTDSAIAPEWLPLPDQIPPSDLEHGVLAIARVSRLLRFICIEAPRADNCKWHEVAFASAFVLPLFSPLLIVAVICGLTYRWSIKSTAIVWLPLLWALKPAKPADRDWDKHLRIESDLRKPQLVAAWSTFCLFVLAVKYALWAGQFELAMKAEAWRGVLSGWGVRVADSPLADAIIAAVRPGAIPLWQVAIFVNSLLGLCLWLKIRSWLAHFKHGVPPTDQSITRTLAVTFFFRHLLTSYVIICDGAIAIHLARKLPVPEIGTKLFPWL